MATPAGYKPSPLGYGSPRTSPFRRPGSPNSPSPLRQTPSASPLKPVGTPSLAGPSLTGPSLAGPSLATPPRFGLHATPSSTWTARNASPGAGTNATPLQPSAEMSGAQSAVPPGSALSQLQPPQVRTLREAFQILDRDGDGSVGRDDVADMLNQMGLPATPSDVSAFFPPGGAQTISMGAFLNALAPGLANMSPAAELLSALSAFDEDDSGQVDVTELRDALLHTAPEPGEPEHPLSEAEINHILQGFTGRRAFTSSTSKSKSGFGSNKRGDVFRYQEFVQSIAGKQGNAGEGDAAE